MGKTVEFALNIGEESISGLRKTSPPKNGMMGRGEEHPPWRGPGYREPTSGSNQVQESITNLTMIQQNNDTTKPHREVRMMCYHMYRM